MAKKYLVIHDFDNIEDVKKFDEKLELLDMDEHDRFMYQFDDILRYDRNKWCFEEGREEGREEGMLLAAKDLLANGASDELILKSTNIAEEQLEELKNEMSE